MGRAWRIEYKGALYHLMSRGNVGQSIFLSDAGRELFLATVGEMPERFEGSGDLFYLEQGVDD